MPTSVTFNNTARSIPNAGELSWQALTGFLVDLGNNAQTTNFQKVGMRVATSSPVTVAAASDCVVVTNLGVAGAVAVNLPAAVTGQMFCIVDGKGDAATNNITITPAAGNINGAATYAINGNRNGIIIAYNGTEWTILAEFLASGTAGSIPRDQLAAGTAGHVIINDGSGVLSSEAQLAITRGGTGAATAPAGFDALAPTTTRGDLVTRGVSSNVSLAVGAASTVLKSDGTDPAWAKIVDANVDAAAAIARSKVAAGTASHVVTNDGSGVLSSEAQLAPVRGGTGQDFSASTGVIKVAAGTVSAGTVGLGGADVSGTLPIGSGGTGQTTANAALNAFLPTQAGNAGKVLQTDATSTSWASVVTDPTTTRGDIIRRGAAALERLAAVTDNRVVRGDGTDVVSGQVDDPDFFTTGAAASASAIGIVTTSAQSFAGLKKFESGMSDVANIRASSSTTQQLANADKRVQVFTPTANHDVELVGTGVKAGETFMIVNKGTAFILTVKTSGGSELTKATSGQYAAVGNGYVVVRALIDSPTAAADWWVPDVSEEVELSGSLVNHGGSYALRLQRQNFVIQASIRSATATFTGTEFYLTGVPSRFRPPNSHRGLVMLTSAGLEVSGRYETDSAGNLAFKQLNGTAFSGTSGVAGASPIKTSITWDIND